MFYSNLVCRKLTRARRIRFAICKWTRHGYTFLASPEQSYAPDLTICMDVHPNPGWESANYATRTPPFPSKRTRYANEAVILNIATLNNQQFHHHLPVVNASLPIYPSLNHQYKFKAVLHNSRKGMYRRSRAGKRVQKKKMEKFLNKSKIQVLVTHRRPRTESIVNINSSNSIVVSTYTKRSNNQNKIPLHNRQNPLNLIDVNITKPFQHRSSLIKLTSCMVNRWNLTYIRTDNHSLISTIKLATWNTRFVNNKSASVCDLIISKHLDILTVLITGSWI